VTAAGAGRLARVPLRTQLLGLLLLSVALVVLVTSLAGTVALRTYLVDRIDDELVAVTRGPLLDVRGPDPGPGRGRKGERRDVAVTRLLYDERGVLRTGGDDDGDGGPELTDPGALPAEPTDVPDVDGGDDWRVLAVPTADGGTFVAAVPLNGVDDTVSQLLVINGAVGLTALGGVGLLAAVAVRRSLRPLRDVERTAEAIAAGDLSVRVPPADPRTEVGSLATSFNVMVDRFESAYSAQQRSEVEARASEGRMRRFVADASHELRTPLTSIRGFAELFRQGAARDPEQLAQVLRRIEDEASRMGLLVEDLLLLARLDQARPLRQEPVDLLTVAADVVHAAATVHASHVVGLDADTSQGLPVVVGDDARLHQVVTNLVGNAVTHTPAGTRVDVGVRRRGPEVLLEVVDDGPGMAAEVAARVFERFYRADASRTRAGQTTTGSGLGLSIVAAIVAAHGGSVDVDTEQGRGSRFVVRLPAADSA
jgi:two-component system, OmpR family, sensor kinase